MSGRMLRSWVIGLLLCLSSAQAAVPVPPLREVLLAITESTRARMLALVAQGNIPGALEMWKIHTGREAPKVLRALQSAYEATNRVAGACTRLARDIYAGIQELGGKAQYLKFTPPGNAPYLGWEVRAGVARSTIQISDTGVHYAVRFKDKIYDAFTGPEGMALERYLERLIAHGGTPVVQVVEKL